MEENGNKGAMDVAAVGGRAEKEYTEVKVHTSDRADNEAIRRPERLEEIYHILNTRNIHQMFVCYIKF